MNLNETTISKAERAAPIRRLVYSESMSISYDIAARRLTFGDGQMGGASLTFENDDDVNKFFARAVWASCADFTARREPQSFRQKLRALFA